MNGNCRLSCQYGSGLRTPELSERKRAADCSSSAQPAVAWLDAATSLSLPKFPRDASRHRSVIGKSGCPLLWEMPKWSGTTETGFNTGERRGSGLWWIEW